MKYTHMISREGEHSEGRVAVPNQMNSPRGSKGGEGAKIYVADFGNVKEGFLSMKFIQKSNFRVQGMFFQQLY